MAGSSRIEERVMDLWDQGLSIERIARQLGITRARSGLIVGTYHDHREQRRAEQAMVVASTRLLTAIQHARMAA